MAKLNTGDRIGHYAYRIIKPLGSNHGNMAEVFLATEGDIDNPPPESLVVIKISRAQEENEEFFRDTIKNEAERLRELRHDGIVRILPLKTTTDMRQSAYEGRATALPGSPWFLVLEYLEGGSLRELLAIHKQLDVKFALEVTRRLAQTLDHIHRLTHVHLDIKPENILFRYQLGGGAPIEPVLIDFGIARNVGQTGLEASTLVYAPPERVQQSRSAPETMPRPDPSMDVYSLGVVLYQMVTGRRPFDGRGAKHISTAILKGDPTIPSTYGRLITPELDGIILQTLHKNPSRRPSAGELELQLGELLNRLSNGKSQTHGPMTTSAISAIPRRQRRLLSLRALFATPAIYAVAVLLVLALSGQAAAKATTGEWWVPTVADLQQAPTQLIGFLNGLLIGPEPTLTEPTLTEPTPTEPTPTVGDNQVAGNSGNDPNASNDDETGSGSVAFAIDITATTVEQAELVSDEEVDTETPTVAPPISEVVNTNTATAAPPTMTTTPTRPTSTPVPDLRPTSVSVTTRNSDTSTEKVPTKDVPGAVSQGTSTPVPDFTPTSTPTRTPTRTPVPVQPTATRTAPQPTKPPVKRSVTLLLPDENASGRERVEFRWTANFTLGPNEAFEPIFWRDGENPMISGKGWGGPTTSNSLVITFDQAAPDNYLWGVLLIKTAPAYERIDFLGSSRRFSVQ